MNSFYYLVVITVDDEVQADHRQVAGNIISHLPDFEYGVAISVEEDHVCEALEHHE